MELKILEKKENRALLRKEIEAELSFFGESTPKKEEVKKKIAETEKVNEELVIVKSIHTRFGEPKASVIAYIYENIEILNELEPKRKTKETKEAEKSQEKTEEKNKETK